MMGEGESDCMKYPKIRREVWSVFLVLVIFVPLIVLVYIQITPRVERVFVVNFEDGADVDVFNATVYNQTDGLYYDITLNPDQYGEEYVFSSVVIAFHQLKYEHESEEFQTAYLFDSEGSDDDVEAMVSNGKYVLRNFAIDDQEGISDLGGHRVALFKMPKDYKLFFIAIVVGLVDEEIEGDVRFYKFFDSDGSDDSVNEVRLNIFGVGFDADYYPIDESYGGNYPYGMGVTTEERATSVYTFDFLVR